MISVNHWGGGQSHHCPPLPSALSTSCGLSLVVILFTQFVLKITEGEAGEEVWSPAGYLIFISTSLVYGKNQ